MDETIVHQPPTEKRLNPFAFPAETDVRFRLLILAVVMLAINVSVIALAAFQDDNTTLLDTSAINSVLAAQDESANFAQSLVAAGQLTVAALLKILSFSAVLGLVLGLAYVIYRGHPGRIRRSRRLTPLSPDKDQKLSAELAALARSAGVKLPQVEIGERPGPADGQVFGTGGKYVMRLGGGMPLLMRKAPAMFRATILHELAHIANGDIPRAYFTQSLWLAIIFLLILPLGLIFCLLYGGNVVNSLSGLLSGGMPDLVRLVTVSTPVFLWNMVQLAGLLVFYATIRGSLLRAREIYADWRSVLWGSAPGLTAIFERGSGPKRGGWLRLWRLHPTPAERLGLLRNPRRLFKIPGDVPLLVGALIGMSSSGLLIASVLTALGVGGALEVLSIGLVQLGGLFGVIGLLTTLLTILLGFGLLLAPQLWLASAAAGSLGLEAQKDSVAALALKERRGLAGYFGLVRPAALFAIGLEFGLLISPAGFFTDVLAVFNYQGSLLTPFVIIPALSVGWVIFVTVLVWLWLVWASHTAGRLLGAQTGAEPPDSRRKFLSAWLAFILWLLLVPALMMQNAIWYDVATAGHLFTPGDIAIFGLVAMVIALMSAAAGWLITEVRRGGAITCPACHRKTRQPAAVGCACEHCGADLAPWLLVETRPI